MANVLPSKKQQALLEYIDGFIKENKYAPSYREVMRALDYKSVSTVAKHINGLIERGWLVKRDNSARSVEVLYGKNGAGQSTVEISPTPPASPSKLSEQDLRGRLDSARTHVEIGATYQHFKGKLYRVTDLVIQVTDDTVWVVYKAQYGEGIPYTRSLQEWLETVDVDGTTVQRFTKQA